MNEEREDPERRPLGLEPSYAWWPSVAHYYGDVVRQMLLGASALLLITSPIYADNIRLEFPFEVIGVLVIVGFAALTNPRNRTISLCDAVIAGVGMVVYGGWPLMDYDMIALTVFVLRIAIALLFLFAFYFSMKTVRAFATHEIGESPFRFRPFRESDAAHDNEELSERNAEMEGRVEAWMEDEQ